MEERSEELWHEKARQLGIVVIIPTYNNEKTLTTVIEDVLFYVEDIIVVNDGSTDSTPTLLENYPNLHIITHPTNKGKGTALKNGLKQAKAAGYRYAITIDSDGQHFASDIPIFMEEIEKEPDTLLVGARNLTSDNMPGKNTFANKFSNFWFKLETGVKLQDTQSGYRLYPLHKSMCRDSTIPLNMNLSLKHWYLQYGEELQSAIYPYMSIIRPRKNVSHTSVLSGISPASVY